MRGFVLALVLVISASCFVLIQAGLADASPLLFASLRLLLAGAVLFLVLYLRHQPLFPARHHWPTLVVLALVASATAYGAMFVSPRLAGAGIAVVVGNLQPLLVLLLAVPLLGEHLTWSKSLALTLGVAGVSLLAFPTLQSPKGGGFAGFVLALLSALGFALGSVLMKRLEPGRFLVTLTAWQLFLGGSLLGSAAWWLEPTWLRLTPTFALTLVTLALFGTAFVTAAWYWLLQSEEVGRLSQ